MSLSIFVPKDGYTVRHRIVGMPGLFPDVEIVYRPADENRGNEFAQAARDEQLAKRLEIIAREVKELRVLKDGRKGDKPDDWHPPLKLDKDQVGQMHRALAQETWNAVIGNISPSEMVKNGEALADSEKNSPSASG